MNQKEGGNVANENHSGAANNSSSSTGFAAGMSTGETGAGSTGAWSSGTGGDPNTCPHCGQPLGAGAGLEQFLGHLGITAEMIDELKGRFANGDIGNYLNIARECLKDGSSKAQRYAKENPGRVAAVVAALALGAGLIWSKCRTTLDLEDRSRQLELKRALGGRKYRLDEVLRELDVNV